MLEALKGIISGPISEFRSTVDNLITNPSNALKRSGIDYQNILPNADNQQPQNFDRNLQIANSILNQATVSPQQPVLQQIPSEPMLQTFTGQNPLTEQDPNQL